MNIKDFFHCKKLRRSERLSHHKGKEKETKTTVESVTEPRNDSDARVTSLGLFDCLPTELVHSILGYVSVPDLSMLSVTSHSMLGVIESYRSTAAAKRKLFPTCLRPDKALTSEEKAVCLKQFRDLGVFMRMSTCLYNTKKRLQIIVPFISKLECTRFSQCRCLYKRLAMSCYGRFVRTIIAGWDEKECCRVFESVQKSTRILKMVKNALEAAPGQHRLLEMSIRIFYRHVFLDESPTLEEQAFWLTLILKPHPIIHQAKLIFIMYGPVCSANIHWTEMSRDVALDLRAANHHFLDLGTALRTLHHYREEWSEDDIVAIIEELTGLPVEWLPENVAGLLYFSGETVPVLLMGNKCLNGRMLEVACLVTCLAMICQKFDNDVQAAFRLTNRVSNIIDNRSDKMKLWSCIIDSFRNHMLEHHANFNDIDDSENEYEVCSPFEQILDAHTAFLQLFLKNFQFVLT